MMPDRSELARDFLLTRKSAPIYRIPNLNAAEPLGPAAIAIGAFDGLHTGHRELIARTVADARGRGCAAYAVTFDPDPDVVLGGDPVAHLLPMAERLRALAATGVDGVIVVPFTRELAALDHAAFFERVLFPVCRVCSIHVGSDFRLGAGGASTVEVIRAWCAPRGIDVTGHELVRDDGAPISATRIRGLLAAGDVVAAAHELGRRFAVRGIVSKGRHEGSDMGFPTANIVVPAGLQMPADGVYAGLALTEGWVWPAAINVGVPPTFADRPGVAALEANLIGFSGELYGTTCALAFDRRLRPSRVFDSTEELISTVLGNIAEVRAEFGEGGVKLGDDL